jgi:hypothetical protein
MQKMIRMSLADCIREKGWKNQEGVGKMFARWILFETRLGTVLLLLLERCTGLAVVSAEWLGAQPSSRPKAEEGTR